MRGAITSDIDAKHLEEFLHAASHRFATLWTITRTDGVVLRFTNHDRPIRDGSQSTYAIASLNLIANTVTFPGNVEKSITPGDIIEISGSSDNDGEYVVTDSVYSNSTSRTTLTLRQALGGGTVDGSVVFKHTWHPAGGYSTSARESQSGLRTTNAEVVGMLSSDYITNDDLRAGRYRNAEIIERIVDWRYPWSGDILTKVYLIGEVSYGNGIWNAQVLSKARLLRQANGRSFTRLCQWTELGGTHCGASIGSSPMTQTTRTVGTVTSASPRQQFTISDLVSQADGYFDDGYLTFTTGANAGLSFEIQRYTSAADTVTLWDKTPFDIQVGDKLTIIVGCDRRFTTCKTKFNNLDRFGGFRWMPGPDRAITSPDARI